MAVPADHQAGGIGEPGPLLAAWSCLMTRFSSLRATSTSLLVPRSSCSAFIAVRYGVDLALRVEGREELGGVAELLDLDAHLVPLLRRQPLEIRARSPELGMDVHASVRGRCRWPLTCIAADRPAIGRVAPAAPLRPGMQQQDQAEVALRADRRLGPGVGFVAMVSTCSLRLVSRSSSPSCWTTGANLSETKTSQSRAGPEFADQPLELA